MSSNETPIKDPVCGMAVDSAPTWSHKQAGETCYFCSLGCHDRFAGNPAKFLNLEPADERPPSPGTTYTWPMYPEVEQDAPGDCPKCGIALEASGSPQRETQYTCPMPPEIVQDEPLLSGGHINLVKLLLTYTLSYGVATYGAVSFRLTRQRNALRPRPDGSTERSGQ